MVFDGWTDVSNTAYTAVLLIFGGNYLYIGNVDTKEERHSADVICKGLLEFLREYVSDFTKIVAVVSDSAPVMVCTKNLVVKEITTAVSVPCNLHI